MEAEQNESPVDLTGSQEDHSEQDSVEVDMPQSEKVTQYDKYAEEKPITHVKNMETKQVFEITPNLMQRRDLMPCDEYGKLVYDHRRFN
jgi:hypothetical protein